MAIDVMSRVADNRITCESEITSVSIYARGALITRTVRLPEEIPDGETIIQVPGITLAANGNSGRARLRAPAPEANPKRKPPHRGQWCEGSLRAFVTLTTRPAL